MPDDTSESSYMIAAEKTVRKLVRQARHNRWWNWGFGIVCAFLVLALIQARVQAVDSCSAGNQFRTSQTQIWDKFVSLATAGQKQTARNQQIINNLLNYVATQDTPRGCSWLSWP